MAYFTDHTWELMGFASVPWTPTINRLCTSWPPGYIKNIQYKKSFKQENEIMKVWKKENIVKWIDMRSTHGETRLGYHVSGLNICLSWLFLVQMHWAFTGAMAFSLMDTCRQCAVSTKLNAFKWMLTRSPHCTQRWNILNICCAHSKALNGATDLTPTR